MQWSFRKSRLRFVYLPWLQCMLNEIQVAADWRILYANTVCETNCVFLFKIPVDFMVLLRILRLSSSLIVNKALTRLTLPSLKRPLAWKVDPNWSAPVRGTRLSFTKLHNFCSRLLSLQHHKIPHVLSDTRIILLLLCDLQETSISSFRARIGSSRSQHGLPSDA